MGAFVRPLYLFLAGIMVIFSEGQDAGGGCVTSKQQDIILVLDSSTSIARADFTKQLAFVNSLIDRIDIGPDANQVGVISFSNNHRLNFHLNKNRRIFRGRIVGTKKAISRAEKEQLKKSITAIRQMGGNTYTHKPLEYIKKYMFTLSRGDRLDKDNVCVVITDGKSSDPEKTIKAAKALAADGVQMFALGVGPAVDSEELADIAGSPQRVFRATSYDELNDISHMFSRTVLGTCEIDKPDQRTLPATTTAAPIPPPIITGMNPEPYSVGKEINLRCSSETTDPTVELSWYKGGVLVPDTSYQVEGNFVVSTYSFDAESEDDGKQVECVLKHSSVSTDMRDTKTIQVKAEPGPPVIVYDSGNTFYTDDLVKLTCYTETEDPGQTDVIWYLDGEVIEGTKLTGAERISNSIVFPAELLHNIARFECRVEFLGFPEPLIDYAEITVKPLPGRPIITADPAGPLATGDRVTLSCTSNGTDSDTRVIWYRENREVDTSFTIGSTSIRNDLTMTALNKEYECRVSHPRIDDDMVAVHRLIVYTTPDKPVIKGPTSALAPNEPVTLECTSQNADVFATLVWKKNGIIIDEDFELLDTNVISNTHRFSSVEEARGSRCEVDHKYLPAPEYAIPRIRQRTVLPGRPIINEGKSIRPVVEGSLVQLRCRSLGTDSNTAVTWYKNGQVEGNSYAIEGDSVVNTISVRASDRDEYECRVTHRELTVPLSDSIGIPILALPEDPVITGVPPSPVIPGTSVTLRCQSRGTSPETQLFWYKRGELVDDSHSISGGYVVNEYTFRADQDHSELQCRLTFPPTGYTAYETAAVAIEALPGPPVITEYPKYPVSIGSRVTVVCVSNGTSPETRLIWYRDNRQVGIRYNRQGDSIRNEYSFSVKSGAPETLECRLEFAPADLSLSATKVIQKQVQPGLPEIFDTPREKVIPGSRVSLRCQSLGTSNETALVWYNNGQRVDDTYFISVDHVVNVYDFVAPANGNSNLECRLNFPPMKFERRAYAVVVVQENPGPLTISGAPSSAQVPGTVVALVCRSLGTSPLTMLRWYVDGTLVDASYEIDGRYISNTYNYTVSDSGSKNIECRLNYAPTDLRRSESVQIVGLGMPGDPTIIGAPTSSVTIGYRTRLVCRSAGTSPSTQLVWYEGGRLVDESYSIVGNYVVNEYEFSASKQGLAELQCRLRFPPGDLDLSAYSRISVKRPDAPTIDQVPTPVWQDQATSLICRVRHDGNRDMKLEWYVKGELVDRTQYEDGSFLINRYDVIASDPKQVYECRLSHGSDDVVTVEHQIKMRDRLPHPIISGSPQNPVNPGDRFNLTCTWHKTGDAASLYWRNALTKQVQPSMVEYDPDKLVSHMSAIANDTRLIIYDCLVDGVTTGKDNDTLVDRVKVKVNDPEPTEECSRRGTQLDLIVILDSSTSIIRPDFRRQVEFVSSFASEFDIGPDGVQIGIVSFSNRDEVNFYMNEYSSKETLQTAISEIEQIGGGTSTHLPIQRTREEMFTALHGDRPDVPNVCIVLTDGKSYDADETHEQARLTREAGIDIYVIGVGTAVDFDELKAIAGESNRVYFSEDYGSLKAIEQDFVKATKSSTGPCLRKTIVTDWSEWSACSATCGAGTHTRTRSCEQGNDNVKCPTELRDTRECIEKVCDQCVSISQRADIAFLLDTSSSVYEPDFDKMKSFLVDFIDLFNISETQQRIASLTFSDEVKVNFHLGDFRTNDDVKAALLRIPMHLGGTRTHDAIKFARQELFSEINGARRNSAKLAFIITDGRSYNPEQTAIEAQIARRSGIIMYSIGIGPETDRSELERIAGKAAQVYHVASYDDIAQLKRTIGVELGRCIPSIGKIDGGYGSWGRYSPCSVTCGVGTKTRTRRCDSPVPRNGGKECEGMSIHTKRCKMPQCGSRPTPRGWTDWEFSSRCSVSCGEGTQEVVRYCQYNDGCRLGEEQYKVIRCQLAQCDPVGNKCGGETGLNVMFASQGINSNGPNSYFAVELIANATASMAVDGKHIRTSLTLSDCTCGKNTGYDLSRYRNFEDIYNHLHDLDLGDTASLLRKVKSENNIIPSLTRGRAFSDNRHQVLVYIFDANDVITEKAVEEAEKLKMAGVTIYAAVLHRDADIGRIRQIVSLPAEYYMSQVESNEQSGSRYVNELRRKLCSVRK